MRVWPVFIDSHPEYLGDHGRSASLLLSPLGTRTVIEHLGTWVEPITERAPIVLSTANFDPAYDQWIAAAYPRARVLKGAEAVSDAVAAFELSDVLLVIDPRCLPVASGPLASLVEHYAEDPRVCQHLVAFESALAGTQERVSFDSSGQVRKIDRHYDQVTWPFIAGVAASLVPVASGILVDGVVPATLMHLRQILAGRGIPSRDFAVPGGVLDLTEEAGLLGANEYFVRLAVDAPSAPDTPVVYVGAGHRVHPTARLTGPVVVHPDAEIGEHAMVLGPAVIGPGATISAKAIIAHATVGSDCNVPANSVVRNAVWVGRLSSTAKEGSSHPSYQDRLARQLTDVRSQVPDTAAARYPVARGAYLYLKRAFDFSVAALGLIALSPVLLVVAAAVRLGSKGPIFYGDEREGVGGRAFRCWKFRTMGVGAHAAQMNLQSLDKMDGPHFKIDRDPRVTRVGGLLRTLNLDELPQLFNVLVGEMSLVGPRPSPFRENQVCVPWREARLSVRPGITGFWQVCRHDRSSGDFHQWIEYDLLYVQNISLGLDARILAATLLTLGGKAGYVKPASLIPYPTTDARLHPSARPATRAEQVVQT